MKSSAPGQAGRQDGRHASVGSVRALVISQHETVRRQLVAYLSRAPALTVSGEPFAPEAIVRVRPDVLIVDLSQLGYENLCRVIDAAHGVGARLIALASIHEPADEDQVRRAGGLYRLKSAGADGLAAIVLDAVNRHPAPEGPSVAS